MAMPPFDGVWYVSIVQKGASAGPRIAIPSASAVLRNADMGFVISGKVSESGQVTVVVNHGNRSAAGSGRLSGSSGSGKWIGDSCSGTWSAERRQNGRIVSYE
jgi:hypothetical protein